jgi:O-antigen/teichoic acid export membrane protein
MDSTSVSSDSSTISIKKLLAVFAGGNLVCMVLRMVGGLLVARATRPEVLGLFNGLSLVLGYVPFLQLGVINGLNRELPYYVGLADKRKARALAACAQAWALMVGTAVAAALMGVAVYELCNGQYELAFGWLTQAWMAFQVVFTQLYLIVIFRTGGSFHKLTTSNVIQAVSSFLLIGVVWISGFYGLCIRAALASLVALYTLWKWRPLKVRAVWDTESFKHLLKIGAPIICAGQIYAWWMVLDSTLVLRYMGVHGLGIYAVAIMATSVIELAPTSLSQICYPRMAEEYGRTGSLRAVTRIMKRPMVYLTLAYIPLVFAGWFIAPPAIRILLPKYVESIRAVQWSCIAAALLVLLPINLIFLVIKRIHLYLVATVIGIGAYALAVLILYKHNHDLSIFPKSLIIGRILFFIVCFGIVRDFKVGGKYENQEQALRAM